MASGDTLIVFTALHNVPPSSNFATLDTRNGVAVLDFNDTTDEEAIFYGLMPAQATTSGGITVTIGWSATDTTVTPQNCVWQAAFMRLGNDTDDVDSATFAAFNGSGAVAEASASGELSYDDITFTDGADMDSVAAGEYFALKIRRDADDTSATDNLTDDAELHFVEISET